MSVKKAQSIVNDVVDRLGITLVAFQNSEIEWLKNQLEEFLELEIETDELEDPEDLSEEDYNRVGLESLSYDDDEESPF